MTNHENIVRFFALEQVVGLIPHRKALIMEYCDGGNLQKLINSKPNGLGSSEFLRICHDLVSAVKHLREKNLVHRDIKPLNILISNRSDGNNVYKLGDFGAARILAEDERFGSLHGTFEYLNPDIFAKMYASDLEIIPPKQSFNANHELWSLGVTFFECVTGHLPFISKDGRNDTKKMYAMISQKSDKDISAKDDENGQIKWATELPETCELDGSLKHDVTNFLAGLLNVSLLLNVYC